jgi:hypothetical protein
LIDYDYYKGFKPIVSMKLLVNIQAIECPGFFALTSLPLP